MQVSFLRDYRRWLSDQDKCNLRLNHKQKLTMKRTKRMPRSNRAPTVLVDSCISLSQSVDPRQVHVEYISLVRFYRNSNHSTTSPPVSFSGKSFQGKGIISVPVAPMFVIYQISVLLQLHCPVNDVSLLMYDIHIHTHPCIRLLRRQWCMQWFVTASQGKKEQKEWRVLASSFRLGTPAAAPLFYWHWCY